MAKREKLDVIKCNLKSIKNKLITKVLQIREPPRKNNDAKLRFLCCFVLVWSLDYFTS